MKCVVLGSAIMIAASVAAAVWAFDRPSIETRVARDPAGAIHYFLADIEAGAAPEAQAADLYGMGLAHERLNQPDEALNDYLSASMLGFSKAETAISRLRGATAI